MPWKKEDWPIGAKVQDLEREDQLRGIKVHDLERKRIDQKSKSSWPWKIEDQPGIVEVKDHETKRGSTWKNRSSWP